MHRSIALLLMAFVLCTTSAAAQGIGLGVGTLIPQGDLADGAKSGLTAGLSIELGRRVAFRAEAFWANSDLKGVIITDPDGIPIPDDAEVSGDIKFVGGVGSLVFHLSDGALRPYLLGGLGLYNRAVAQDAEDAGSELSRLSTKESKVGWHGGFGLKLQLGPVEVFGEARYHSISTEGARTKFAPVMIGVRL